MGNELILSEIPFFVEQYQRYEEHLKRKNIFTVADYLDEYNELKKDELEKVDDTTWNEIIDTPLDALYSIHPYLGQDIMIVDLNPGTKNDITDSFGGTNEYTRKKDAMAGKAGEERLSELTWHMGSHYGIDDHLGRESVVRAIYRHFSSSPTSFEEYLTYEGKEAANSAFEDIYFSRLYKWPSSRKSDLREDDIGFGKKEFIKELEVVKPELLIVACEAGWNILLSEYRDEMEVHRYGSTRGTITEKYGSSDTSDIGGIYEIPGILVLTLPHPSPTTWNTSEIDEEELEDLILECRSHL